MSLLSVFQCLLRMQLSSFCGAVICLLFTTGVSADTSEPSRWYLGLEAGLSSGSPNSEDLNAQLANRGLTATATVDDSSAGARIYLGRHLGASMPQHRYDVQPKLSWALELGYNYLGDFEVALSAAPGNEDALIAATVDEKPRSGHALDVALAMHLRLDQHFTLKPHAGFFYNHQELVLRINGARREATSDVIGVVAGLGGWWRLNRAWQLGLDWSLYIDNGSPVSQLRLGVNWR